MQTDTTVPEVLKLVQVPTAADMKKLAKSRRVISEVPPIADWELRNTLEEVVTNITQASDKGWRECSYCFTRDHKLSIKEKIYTILYQRGYNCAQSTRDTPYHTFHILTVKW